MTHIGLGKLDLWVLLGVFITSAIMGDALNYAIGNKLGKVAMRKGLINTDYIRKTGAVA